MNQNDKKEYPAIRKLYPEFTFEEQAEAEDTLKRYVALVWRIYNRKRREKRGKI
ncbi:MAG: hypothetical protein LC768_01920 [Acidobacteria bacterium]|nr:hypothetical protein [Acidobacteriota bacterium]MCA1637089.1 hypothetical protein [Acidobacteriota bacterium]